MSLSHIELGLQAPLRLCPAQAVLQYRLDTCQKVPSRLRQLTTHNVGGWSTVAYTQDWKHHGCLQEPGDACAVSLNYASLFRRTLFPRPCNSLYSGSFWAAILSLQAGSSYRRTLSCPAVSLAAKFFCVVSQCNFVIADYWIRHEDEKSWNRHHVKARKDSSGDDSEGGPVIYRDSRDVYVSGQTLRQGF